ncbi:vesicle coat component [Diaporthe eres]
MPNFSADVAADTSISESDKPYNPRPEAAFSAQPEAPPAPEPDIDVPRTRESSVADEWFPNYEVGSPRKQDPEPQAEMPVRTEEPELGSGLEAGDAPFQEEEPEAHNEEETPADVVDTTETNELAQPEAEAVQDPQNVNSSAPKHVSSDSFARTVSHQPNWMDDEEPEWSLPRAETDLFNRYMPPNERTNSFPVVPQSGHHENEVVEPLPANQAEDVLHEIEHETESLEHEDEDSTMPRTNNALHQDNFWGDDDGEAGFTTQGGDLQAPEEEASDARYAEGLPLIDHQDAAEPAQTESSKARDPFSLDGEDDDFFDQVAAGGNNAEAETFSPGQLERKSTMQVLNGLDTTGSKGLGGLVEDTLEEEDEDERQVEPVAQEEPTKPTEDSIAAEAPGTAGQGAQEPRGEDIAAKWSEAFASDDDDGFLLEDEPVADGSEQKAVDPSAFFLDDDEGFLEDVEDTTTPQPPQPSSNISQPAQTPASTTGNRYLPTSTTQPGAARSPNPYIPSASPAVPQPQILNSVPLTPPVAANPYAVQPPPLQHSTTAPLGAHPTRPPAVNKAQSFADKAKGGYHSPYDLPMEVVKPKKRASLQQMPRASPAPVSGPPAPPRSSSMHSQGPPVPHISPAPAHGSMAPGPDQTQNSTPTISPQSPVHPGQAPSDTKRPQQLKPKASFFEDLPSSHKVRPASRTSNKSQPSPSQASFSGPPQASHPPPSSSLAVPHESLVPGHPAAPDIAKLVPPAPANPYVSLPTGPAADSGGPPPSLSRYSPAPAQGSMPSGSAPPPMSRYSPAPPAQRSAATPPTVLPHLPRTSSPLANFEVSHDRQRPVPGENGLHSSRSNSTSHEPRLNRMTSLPPTREVEEEDPSAQPTVGAPPRMAAAQSAVAQDFQQGQFAPESPQRPPVSHVTYNPDVMSAPKRKISYGPAPVTGIVPPPRSSTGSPGAMSGLRSPIKASEMVPRPSSAYSPSPASIANIMSPNGVTSGPTPAVSGRPRGMSQKLNLIPPTDGREHDPLQRWRGCPLISWGSGGMIVTSFPVDVPRYGMNQPAPMIVRSPGEVVIKTIKDIQPLEERLAKFPGPLKGKSKKKETIAWLTAGIQELEQALPNPGLQSHLSHEDKRATERVLLWKILRTFIENDGVLEGNPAVEKGVRDVLSNTTTGQSELASPIYTTAANLGSLAGEPPATQMQSDSVDPATVQQLKESLMAGEREKAVWDAADKRLWGHALLIANTVSAELYHKVSQEFIKKEVNFPGRNNESLAALYAVLSGNHAECVDELVPTHARAGVQLIASTSRSTGGGVDGLEKWRETLTLVLSNRSAGDVQALNSLGNLLSEYGRAEAAHICFLFSRTATVFGGLDDPQAQFVLVGADHRKQAQQFFKETEALLLSEVYEYGLSLSGASHFATGVPHLAVYKLQHAITLAEYGFRDKAMQYCDIISKDMSAQTRRSPYHHVLLETTVEDLRQRIAQSPHKEASGSWISKPSMNKVSDSMWSRFNKFVAGDENETPGQGSPKLGDDSGPFGRIAGGTPTISRPASASNATGMEMFGSPNGFAAGVAPLAPAMSPQLTRASSRYAPSAAQPAVAASPYEPAASYTPMGRSSMERTSSEYSRGPYEPRRPSSDVQAGHTSAYTPNSVHTPAQNLPDPGLGISSQSPYQPARPAFNMSASAPAPAGTSVPTTPAFSPYASFSQDSSPYAPAAPATSNASHYAPVAPAAEHPVANNDTSSEPSMGYQPPSYGYEPPSTSSVEQGPAETEHQGSSGGYEPPSYQPHGFEPPSYLPNPEPDNDNADGADESKPKKKSFMDDDDDDFPSMRSMTPGEKSKAEKDKENEEMFRKVAEEEAKRAEAEKAAKSKKGWGLTSWFGGGGGSKKDSLENSPNKPIRAKLGEKSSFVYDPDQKRWVNKASGAEESAPKSATPPPPRATPRPAGAGTPPPPGPSSSAPPLRPTPPVSAASSPNLSAPSAVPPSMMRSVSNTSSVAGGPPSAPPSRPATSMSNASSIDDLLGAAMPRKGASAKGKKKGGRYVDVMAK